ncbi:MAG: helix-turn-helix domain-containing protein, partial [Oscillospiraceae bacterium]
YLTNYRISEACFLLKSSQLSIAEIAVSVGFFDQFYFSRVFKKNKGVPPSRYLASLQEAK